VVKIKFIQHHILSTHIHTRHFPFAEAAKLEQHLELLRDQYSLLQDKYERVQQERDLLSASSSNSQDRSSFTAKLLNFVAKLHNQASANSNFEIFWIFRKLLFCICGNYNFEIFRILGYLPFSKI